jgi:hypothetical protein
MIFKRESSYKPTAALRAQTSKRLEHNSAAIRLVISFSFTISYPKLFTDRSFERRTHQTQGPKTPNPFLPFAPLRPGAFAFNSSALNFFPINSRKLTQRRQDAKGRLKEKQINFEDRCVDARGQNLKAWMRNAISLRQVWLFHVLLVKCWNFISVRRSLALPPSMLSKLLEVLPFQSV